MNPGGQGAKRDNPIYMRDNPEISEYKKLEKRSAPVRDKTNLYKVLGEVGKEQCNPGEKTTKKRAKLEVWEPGRGYVFSKKWKEFSAAKGEQRTHRTCMGSGRKEKVIAAWGESRTLFQWRIESDEEVRGRFSPTKSQRNVHFEKLPDIGEHRKRATGTHFP